MSVSSHYPVQPQGTFPTGDSSPPVGSAVVRTVSVAGQVPEPVIAPPRAPLRPILVPPEQPEASLLLQVGPPGDDTEIVAERGESSLRRYISFAGSVAFHLGLLILLALTGNLPEEAPEPAEFQAAEWEAPVTAYIELLPDEADTKDEAFEEEPLFEEMAGDGTDFPDTTLTPAFDAMSAPTVASDFSLPKSYDLSRDGPFSAMSTGPMSKSMLADLGGRGGMAVSGTGGGGTGGLGPGLTRNMMAFNKRLRKAGAKTGDVQISLIWDNYNDLDLHVITPSNETIFFGHRRSRCRGELDVDMNAGGSTSREPVENIFWPKGRAPFGKYRVVVHHFQNHGDPDPTTFEVRVVVDGQTEVIQGKANFPNQRQMVYEFERSASKPLKEKPSPGESQNSSDTALE